MSNKYKTATFVKYLGLVAIGVIIYSIVEFTKIPLTLLTRPSALEEVARLVSFLPALLYLFTALLKTSWQCKLFKNSRSADKFTEVIISIQMFSVLTYLFMELRFTYLLQLLKLGANQWYDIVLALFYVCLLFSNRLAISKAWTLTFGFIYVVSQLSISYANGFALDSLTIASIVTVIIYMLYTVAFVDLKNGIYYKNFTDKIPVNSVEKYDKYNIAYVVSAIKDDKAIIALTYCPECKEYLLFNLKTKEYQVTDYRNSSSLTKPQHELFLDSISHDLRKKTVEDSHFDL